MELVAGERRTEHDSSTDGEGRFSFTVDEHLLGSPATLCLRLDTSVAWPAPIAGLQRGEHELGDVVFALLPVLARLRFTGGEVEGDMTFSVQVQQPGERLDRWQDGNDLAVVRTASRHYEIRGRPELPRVQVRWHSNRHANSSPLVIELPRDDEVVIPLVRAVSILAQLELAGMPAKGSGLFLSAAPAASTEPRNRIRDPELLRSTEGRHDYQWQRLLPGTYRVSVFLGHTLAEVHALTGGLPTAYLGNVTFDDQRRAAVALSHGSEVRVQLFLSRIMGEPAPLGSAQAAIPDDGQEHELGVTIDPGLWERAIARR